MAIEKITVRLKPVGADGAALVTRTRSMGGPGFVRAISVDYVNQPSTTDLVIKTDDTNGVALLTATSSNTDIVKKALGAPGIDETGAALAATDASSGGIPFDGALYFDVAQGDAGATKYIDVTVWIEK